MRVEYNNIRVVLTIILTKPLTKFNHKKNHFKDLDSWFFIIFKEMRKQNVFLFIIYRKKINLQYPKAKNSNMEFL